MSFQNTEQRKFYNLFKQLTKKHNGWQVWQDFIILSACSVAPIKRAEQRPEFLDIARKYEWEELSCITTMLEITISALEKNPEQDFLGELYRSLCLGIYSEDQVISYSIGGFLSPPSVERLKTTIANQGWIALADSACGSGAMIIAAANELQKQGINYQRSVLFTAQDKDRIAALMSYVQMSLLGCSGYAIVTPPTAGATIEPKRLPWKQVGQEIWVTPMTFSELWQERVFMQQMRAAIDMRKEHVIS